MLVRESISFERGKDPKEALGIGIEKFIKNFVENETRYTYEKNMSCLLWICGEYGKTELVEHILSNINDYMKTDDEYKYQLHFAIKYALKNNHEETLKVLRNAPKNLK